MIFLLYALFDEGCTSFLYVGGLKKKERVKITVLEEEVFPIMFTYKRGK